MEEEEIMKLEEVLGMETDENRVFLSQKFDEVYDKFKTNNNEIELLLLENEKLNEYLSRLDKMEQKMKTKKNQLSASESEERVVYTFDILEYFVQYVL